VNRISEIENQTDLVSVEGQSEKPIKIRPKITHIPRRDYSCTVLRISAVKKQMSKHIKETFCVKNNSYSIGPKSLI